MKKFTVQHATKLHKFLKQVLNLPYHFLQKLCRRKQIMLNEVAILKQPQKYPVKPKDQVIIYGNIEVFRKINLPSNLNPAIVHETQDVFVIDKQGGIASQGGRYLNKMNYAIFAKEKRLYPVHRLDFYTTGIMLFAKNIATAQFLSKQFAHKKIEKYYLAYVKYKFDSAVSVQSRINGKSAVSYFLPLSPHVILVRIISGKKHQIRQHLLLLNNQLVYDTKYTIKSDQFAHKRSIKSDSFYLTDAELLKHINVLNNIILSCENSQGINYLPLYKPIYNSLSPLEQYIQYKAHCQKHLFLHHIACKICKNSPIILANNY